jgi:sugar lactone lactonase YvrE
MTMCSRLKFRSALKALSFCAALAIAIFTVPSAQAQLPAVSLYGARVAYAPPSGGTGNFGKITRDSAGNIFALQPSTPRIIEIPVSGPLQVVVPSTDPSMTGVSSITSDPAGNLYVAHSAAGVTEVTRNANGTYNLGSSEITIAPANLSGTIDGYYYQSTDIAVDSLGNIYLIVNTNGYMTGVAHGGGIYMAGPSAPSGQFLVGSFTTQTSPLPTSLAVDSANNLFYADGTNTYEITAASVATAVSTSTPLTSGTIIGSSSTIGAPKYVFLDNSGNVYVGNGTLGEYVIVNNGSAFSASSATYELPAIISSISGSGVHSGYNYGAVDNQGNLILAYSGSLEFYGGGKFYNASGSNTYGITTATGGAGSGTTIQSGASFGLLFSSTVTLNGTTDVVNNASGSFYGGAGTGANAYNAANGGTTCVAGTTYTAGQSCTIEIGYKAYQPGYFNAGVNIYGGASSSSTSLLASLTGFGISTGPAVTFDTGSKTAVGTGYAVPTGIAVDNTGAMYVADSTNNLVYKFAAGSTSSSAATASFGTGLSSPSGVTIDPAGNLYIADTGNNRVVYFPNNSGTLGTQTVLATSGFTLSSPRGIAVDGYGNIYIADTGNSRVLVVPNPFAGAVGKVATVGSGFTSPYGIAIDKLLNVYVADKGANAVYEVPGGAALTTSSTTNVGSGTIITVGSGYSGPTGVGVDPSGTVYVADGGNSTIWKVPFTAGAFGTKVALFTATSGGIAKPFGIALDLTSDLYFTDSDLPGVFFDMRSAAAAGTASTLAFGSVAVSGTSTLPATLDNAGYTTTLTGSLSTAPAAPYATATNACGSSISLVTGASCAVSVTFTGPSTTDTNQAGSMIFTTNELNNATSFTTVVALSGESTGAVSAVAITGDATTTYGAPETYTVTATDASGNPAAVNGTFTVSISGGAGSSTASVTLTGGKGTFLLPSLGASGTAYSLSTTVSGMASNALSVTVNKAPLTVTAASSSRIFDQANPAFTVSYSGLANGDTTSSVFTAAPTSTTTATRVSPAGSYTLTANAGTLSTAGASNYNVTYVNGTLTVSGSAPQTILFPQVPNFTQGNSYTLTGVSTSGLPLSYTVTNGTGSATVSGSVLTVNSAGTITITATQAGNGNYAAASSVARSFTAQ